MGLRLVSGDAGAGIEVTTDEQGRFSGERDRAIEGFGGAATRVDVGAHQQSALAADLGPDGKVVPVLTDVNCLNGPDRGSHSYDETVPLTIAGGERDLVAREQINPRRSGFLRENDRGLVFKD